MQKLVVANWKANKDLFSAQAWLSKLLTSTANFHPRLEIVIAPPLPFLWPLREQIKQAGNNQFVLAAQDISRFPAGSYTGAVAAQNLRGLGVKYGLVGHSEQRKYFAETNQSVAQKIDQLISVGITPIICTEKENLEAQAATIDRAYLKRVIVAYDPIDAISTQGNLGLKSMTEVAGVIQQTKNIFGQIPIIYGGSVDEQSVGQYMLETDGVLVGGASLSVDQFRQLLINAWAENKA